MLYIPVRAMPLCQCFPVLSCEDLAMGLCLIQEAIGFVLNATEGYLEAATGNRENESKEINLFYGQAFMPCNRITNIVLQFTTITCRSNLSTITENEAAMNVKFQGTHVTLAVR
jgi:hypothetical protein